MVLSYINYLFLMFLLALSTENSPIKTWAGSRASQSKQSKTGTRSRHLSDFVQVSLKTGFFPKFKSKDSRLWYILKIQVAVGFSLTLYHFWFARLPTATTFTGSPWIIFVDCSCFLLRIAPKVLESCVLEVINNNYYLKYISMSCSRLKT